MAAPRKADPPWLNPPTTSSAPAVGPRSLAKAAGPAWANPPVMSAPAAAQVSTAAPNDYDAMPMKSSKKKAKPKSLFEQFLEAGQFIASAPVMMPYMAAKAGAHAGQFAADYLGPDAKQDIGTSDEVQQKYFPEATGMGKSLAGFSTRVGNLAPIPHSTGELTGQDVGAHLPEGWKSNSAYYQDKIDKGEIVGAGIEDLGNLAIITGAGAKLMGSPGYFAADMTASERAGVLGLDDAELSGPMERVQSSSGRGFSVDSEGNATPGLSRHDVAPPLQPPWIPGRGAAGLLEGVTTGPKTFLPENAGWAERVGNTGKLAHDWSAGADTFFRPFKTAGNLAEAGAKGLGWENAGQYRLSNLAPQATEWGVQKLVDNTKVGKQVLSGLTAANRNLSGLVKDVQSQYSADVLTSTRRTLDPATIARRFGLSDAQSSAAISTVDNLFWSLTKSIRENPEAQAWLDGQPTQFDFDGLINGSWSGKGTQGVRPTPEMIRTLMQYEDGSLRTADAGVAATMDAVAEAQRRVSGARSVRSINDAAYVAGDKVKVGTKQVKDPVTGEVTEEPVYSTHFTRNKEHTAVDHSGNEKGLVSPEEFGNTLMPSEVIAKQNKLQLPANMIKRDLEKAKQVAMHDRRVADAMDAIVNRLPDPANVNKERDFGKYTERDAIMRREHARAVKEVERAVKDYVDLSESETTPAAWAEAEKRLDRARDRAEDIREQIVQAKRRQDAAFVLSRASGEFEPGARRTYDPNKLSGVTEVSDDVRMPEVDVAGQPAKAEIRARLKRRQAEVESGILDELDRMSPEGRTIRSTPGMKKLKNAGGEHDFWELVSDRDRRKLIGEKWFGRKGAIVPDDLMRHNEVATSSQHAAELYIDKIKQLWRAREGGGANYVEDIAAEMNLPVEAVQAALHGTLADYAGALRLEPGNIMADLRKDFEALEGEDAGVVKNMLQQVMDDPTTTQTELAQALSDLLPRTSIDEIQTMLIDNNVDMHDLANYVLNGEATTSLRAVMDTRTSAQYEQLGRMSGNLTGLRSALDAAGTEEDLAIRSLTKAVRQSEQAEASAAATIDKAQRRERWLAERQGKAQGKIPDEAGLADPKDTTWRRYEQGDGTWISQGERDRQRQGMAHMQAQRSERAVKNLSRAYDRAQWKVGNVPAELGRDFQTRLLEDVNSPALNRTSSAVRKNISALGDIKGRGEERFLTGALGRLAGKYGVYDDVIGIIEQIEHSKAIDSGWEPGLGDFAGGNTMPLIPLEPMELHDALHMALQGRGKQLEDFEATTFGDSAHSGQLGLNLENLYAEQGLTRQDRPGIVANNATGIEAPGALKYKPRPNGRVWTGQGGKALQAPFAAHELIKDYFTEWNAPQEVKNAVAEAERAHLDARDRFLSRKIDEHAKAIPAPYRGIHQVAKLEITHLLEKAAELREKNPATADVYSQMAWDVSSGLDQMVAAGVAPQHMIGGPEASPNAPGGGTSGIGNRRTPKASKLKTTGFRELNVDAYARIEAREMKDWLMRRRDHVVGQAFARNIAEIPEIQQKIVQAKVEGRELSAADIGYIARDEGWVPLDPKRGVGADTEMIPRRVRSALDLDNWFDSDHVIAKGFQGLNAWNAGWKTLLLGLSPKWVMGNVLGMTLAAGVHGGVGPGEFFRQMERNVRAQGGLWNESAGQDRRAFDPRRLTDKLAQSEVVRNEGLLPELPGQLSTSSLTRNEFQIAYQRKAEELSRRSYSPLRVTDKVKSVVYPGNEVFDNLSKSTVYLAKLRDGVPREAALKSTLDAMGNYNAMSTFERRVVREALPFYAWMRQSSKVMLRLPYVSPMRAALVYSIGTALMDPDVTLDVQRMIGSRFRIGSGNTFFDFGSFNPNADLSEQGLTAFDPRNIGASLSPVLRFGIQEVFGVDPATMNQETRPNDTYNREAFGQKGATPSWSLLLRGDVGGFAKETGWALRGLTPQSRGLSELAYGDEKRYAGTGYPIPKLPRDKNISWNRSLLRAAQLPGLYTLNISDAQKAAAKRAKAGK